MDDTAKMSPVRAVLTEKAKATRTPDAVTAIGSLDALRYGRALKARQLVGVRGAATAFDGFRYVKSVTHMLKLGSFNTSFEPSRSGLFSPLPKVSS